MQNPSELLKFDLQEAHTLKGSHYGIMTIHEAHCVHFSGFQQGNEAIFNYCDIQDEVSL